MPNETTLLEHDAGCIEVDTFTDSLIQLYPESGGAGLIDEHAP